MNRTGRHLINNCNSPIWSKAVIYIHVHSSFVDFSNICTHKSIIRCRCASVPPCLFTVMYGIALLSLLPLSLSDPCDWTLSTHVASATADFYQRPLAQWRTLAIFGRVGRRLLLLLGWVSHLCWSPLGHPSASYSHSYIVTHYNGHWVGPALCVSVGALVGFIIKKIKKNSSWFYFG